MSGYAIEVISEVDGEAFLSDLLRAAAQATLLNEEVPLPAGLSILLTDDAQLHALNLAYRDEDKPTDVLSFALEGPAGPALAGYLGDIAISMETAQRQADTAGHRLADELCLLAVHGVLHLLGYDHDNPMAEAGMWAVQDRILRSLAEHPEK